MQIITPDQQSLSRALANLVPNQLAFALINAAPFYPDQIDQLKDQLAIISDRLIPGGLLFMQGLPLYLAELGVSLSEHLNFKYWITLESRLDQNSALPSVHCGLLLFIKDGQPLKLKQLRTPHLKCDFCGKTRKDWGGKSHLMHPQGYALSDIWTDLPDIDPDSLNPALIDRILALLDLSLDKINLISNDQSLSINESIGLIAPIQSLPSINSAKNIFTINDINDINSIDSSDCLNDIKYIYSNNGNNYLNSIETSEERAEKEKNDDEKISTDWIDSLKCGDIISVLKQIPDNSINLAFADPPYNLQKAYNSYADEREDQGYIEWCEKWLREYVRIIKPTGSLFVLNLPRWTMHHAAYLNQHLCLQNWIVWDALAEPRGRLMPAHYGLLFYTKSQTDFTWNYNETATITARNYCRRPNCLTKRKNINDEKKESLTDLWWNIHRIRHRRDRDYHPCQLPDSLLERIIKLTTNEGDLVLDGFCGVGTTPIIAKKLKRNFIAIDIDKNYLDITERKLAEIETRGEIKRERINRPARTVTKKELQLALRKLAEELGRLPTPQDIEQLSKYSLTMVMEKFTSWSKAIRAAKINLE